jgi:hypothetical protein
MIIILSILLIQILLDSSGDAFRLKGWQKLQHLFESLQIVCWTSLIFLHPEFSYTLIAFYVLARFVFFDITFNLITGNYLDYVGNPKNSFYAWFLDLIFARTGITTIEIGTNTLKAISLFLLICETYNLLT